MGSTAILKKKIDERLDTTRPTLRSVAIVLCVAVLFLTAVLVGTVSWTVLVPLIDSAHDAADEELERAFIVSQFEVEKVTAELFLSYADLVQRDIHGLLDMPELTLLELSEFLQQFHPDQLTDSHFIDEMIRPELMTTLRSLAKHGMRELMYEALPFSPSFPNATSHRGGLVTLYAIDDQVGELPESGGAVYFVGESRDPEDESVFTASHDYNQAYYGGHTAEGYSEISLHVGRADVRGHMLDKGHPCFWPAFQVASGDFEAGLSEQEQEDFSPYSFQEKRYNVSAHTVGECIHDKTRVLNHERIRSSKLALYNMFNEHNEHNATEGSDEHSHGTVKHAGDVHFSPMFMHHSETQIDAYLAVTHPLMFNKYESQEHRLGVLSCTMDGTMLGRNLHSHHFPEGAVLYVIDYSDLTNHVPILIGSNMEGDLEEVNATITVHGKQDTQKEVTVKHMVRATDHLKQTPEGEELSEVAHHTRYTLTHEGGYDRLVELTTHHFYEWTLKTESEETTYWCITTLYEQGEEIHWYVNVLIPRKSVMHDVDVSNAELKQHQKDSRDEANEKRASGIVIAIGVTCAVVAGLVGLVSYIIQKLVEPIQKLCKDMTLVSHMLLEEVDNYNDRTPIRDIYQMQISFGKMKDNLAEFRQYIPQAVMVSDISGSGKENRSSGINASGSGPNGSGSFPVNHKTSFQLQVNDTRRTSSSNMKSAGSSVDPCGASTRVKKRMSLVWFNVVGWHAIALETPDVSYEEINKEVMQCLISTMKMHCGVQDLFSGDKVMATFNAFTVNTHHRAQAINCAIKSRVLISQIAMPSHCSPLVLSFGCTAGTGLVDSLGCLGMKKITITSPAVGWSYALERVNRKLDFHGIVDMFASETCERYFEFKTVGAVKFPKRLRKGLIRIYEARQRATTDDSEWMYELANLDASSKFVVWNTIWEHVIAEKWESAAAAISGVKESPIFEQRELDYLKDIVDKCHYAPPTPEYH